MPLHEARSPATSFRPGEVPVTVRFLAEELGMPLDELCAQLAANTLEVYGAFED